MPLSAAAAKSPAAAGAAEPLATAVGEPPADPFELLPLPEPRRATCLAPAEEPGDGLTFGGYYADVEQQCQVVHKG